MNILGINAGSSSVKFSLLHAQDYSVLCTGMIERIGLDGTEFHYENSAGRKENRKIYVKSIFEAVSIIQQALTRKEIGVIDDVSQITAIGHRVVHGGEEINKSVFIDKYIKDIIRSNIPLAPLHNPPNLEAIEACETLFDNITQVAIFDTAFYSPLPKHVYLYAIPYEYYSQHKIRRYGFHGISHKYVSEAAANYLSIDYDNSSCISCHLGNGCSITAVQKGKAIDTSMGLTPLEGLIMGTRSGDIDPSIIEYLLNNTEMDYKDIFTMLNKQSGLYGLSGIGSSDLRDIESAIEQGSQQAQVCLDAFCYRIKKYIGSYMAVLSETPCIIFTGGIGENSVVVREKVCSDLNVLGLGIDREKNRNISEGPREIQSEGSRLKILVIPTDEVKEMTKQVVKLMKPNVNVL